MRGLSAEIILDKTPRYYQVLSDLVSCEDDLIKIVILRRPVLEVMASYEKTFGNILYKIPIFKNEFIEGVIALSGDYSSSTVVLTYDELVKETEATINQLNAKLDLRCSVGQARIGCRIGKFGDPRYENKESIIALN